MKSPLLKLFNSAIGRHSSDDLKSKATPPPSPSYLAMGPTKVRRESGHEIDQQRHTAQQRHQDMGEPFESQLTPVLMDRSHTDSGLVSSCALDCRRISSGVPATIEYASLEFQSCGGDGQKTPAFIPSIATQCGTTGYSDSNATVYAQIDLSKSEAIKKCVRH